MQKDGINSSIIYHNYLKLRRKAGHTYVIEDLFSTVYYNITKLPFIVVYCAT